MDPKRKLRLNLRRKVSVQRRFSVEYLGDGTEKVTCRTCGWSDTQKVLSNPRGPAISIPPKLAERLSKYRSNGGVTGICPRCTKKLRDERYPLA